MPPPRQREKEPQNQAFKESSRLRRAGSTPRLGAGLADIVELGLGCGCGRKRRGTRWMRAHDVGHPIIPDIADEYALATRKIMGSRLRSAHFVAL